jgi:hypothetical protein
MFSTVLHSRRTTGRPNFHAPQTIHFAPGWADQLIVKLEEDKKQIALTNRRLVSQRKAKIIEINGRLQKLVETFLDDLVDRETYAAEKAMLLGEKKSIEEQRDCLNTGRTSWLEPFEKWILSAKNAEKVVVSGTKDEKRGLALEVFGSNMILDYKKASGTSIKLWSFIPEKVRTGGVVALFNTVRAFFQEHHSTGEQIGYGIVPDADLAAIDR